VQRLQQLARAREASHVGGEDPALAALHVL
jgi:hypothetical protein